MGKIDTSEWAEFIVGEMFEIRPTKAYKMTNVELMDGGNSPVVVNSAYNNGIGGYSVRRHIVGGTNRRLFSVKTPPRLHSLIGDCTMPAVSPQTVIGLFERQRTSAFETRL